MLQQMNIKTESDIIRLLQYFDVLCVEYYENLFTYIIPDDDKFKTKEIQSVLMDTINNSPDFKFWVNFGIPSTDGYQLFENNGCSISFKIDSNIITYLKIVKDNIIFERKG